MKKLTAGIFTVLMGLVSVNAADAAVASQGYVDSKVGVNATAISDMETAYKAADTSLQQNIDKKVDQTAYDEKIQSLEGVDQGFNTRLETVEKLSGDGESAAATKTELNTVKDSIGTVETGKTVVGMIGENTTAINGITTSGYATSGITKEKVDAYDAHVADADIHVTADQKTAWTAKQDAIADLADIRSGATAGATALQPSALNPYSTTEQMNSAISTAKNEAIAAIPTVDTTFVETSTNPATSAAISTFVSGELENLNNANNALGGRLDTVEDVAEANADAIEAIQDETNGILAQAKTDAKSQADAAQTAAEQTAAGALSAAKSELEAKIDDKANSADVYSRTEADAAFLTSAEVQAEINAAVADNGTVKTVVDTAISTLENGAVKNNADAIKAIQDSGYANSGITADLVAKYNAYEQTIASNAAAATDAASAAETAAKSYTDTKIANLKLNDLSRVPAECSAEGKYCVLTSDGTNYLWEAIERATGEAQPAGTAIPSVTQ